MVAAIVIQLLYIQSTYIAPWKHAGILYVHIQICPQRHTQVHWKHAWMLPWQQDHNVYSEVLMPTFSSSLALSPSTSHGGPPFSQRLRNDIWKGIKNGTTAFWYYSPEDNKCTEYTQHLDECPNGQVTQYIYNTAREVPQSNQIVCAYKPVSVCGVHCG